MEGKNLERAASCWNNDCVSVLSKCISSVLDHIHISSDRVLSYHCQDFSERQFHGVLVRLRRVWRWTLCLLVSFGKRNRASLWGGKRWWVQRRLHFCWSLPSEVAWTQQMLDVILPKQLRHHGVLNRTSERSRQSCLHLDVKWGAFTLSLWTFTFWWCLHFQEVQKSNSKYADQRVTRETFDLPRVFPISLWRAATAPAGKLTSWWRSELPGCCFLCILWLLLLYLMLSELYHMCARSECFAVHAVLSSVSWEVVES